MPDRAWPAAHPAASLRVAWPGQSVQLLLHPAQFGVGSEDRARHHRGQGALLELGSGLCLPLPNPHIFDAASLIGFARSRATPPLALPNAQPVGRDQRSARVRAAVDVGFHELGLHPVALQPIRAHALQGQSITAGGQVGPNYPRSNQEPGQTDDSTPILSHRLSIPPNPTIPARQIEGGRTKTNRAHTVVFSSYNQIT